MVTLHPCDAERYPRTERRSRHDGLLLQYSLSVSHTSCELEHKDAVVDMGGDTEEQGILCCAFLACVKSVRGAG